MAILKLVPCPSLSDPIFSMDLIFFSPFGPLAVGKSRGLVSNIL